MSKNHKKIGNESLGGIKLAEVYTRLDNEEASYARLYTKPGRDNVPTICLGPIDDVGKIAYRDNLTIHPYKGRRPITTCSGLISPESIEETAVIQPIWRQIQGYFTQLGQVLLC